MPTLLQSKHTLMLYLLILTALASAVSLHASEPSLLAIYPTSGNFDVNVFLESLMTSCCE